MSVTVVYQDVINCVLIKIVMMVNMNVPVSLGIFLILLITGLVKVSE